MVTLAGRGVFARTACGPLSFCPGDRIDRKTMAVWMVRVLDGRDPQPVTESRFDDVEPSSFHARFIERFAELGITSGCGDGSEFCPDAFVTRLQVAAFLAKAYGLAEGPDPGFVDVPAGVWYADPVARLASSGITSGCGSGPPRFCPGSRVTRAQMATFLYRAQNLRAAPLAPTPVLVGGFTDVANGAYYTQPVVTLSGRGVFARTECAPQGFCPGDPIDRKTMAVWMVRLLEGRDPSAVSASRFEDVDPSGFYAPFIERLAELEVTSGCGDSEFCPDSTVTRAQVAVLLARAYELAEGPDPGFVDVRAGAWYADRVARLAASGITSGCGSGPPRFCPDDKVTRAQMATFLYRAETRP